MLQRWKRENSAGDQSCPASVFPFVFQEMYDDDFYQKNYFLSNPSGQVVEECEQNNISKNQNDLMVAARDMATEASFAPSNSALLSLVEFSLLSLTFVFGLVASLLF
jgi:hypothetical protein